MALRRTAKKRKRMKIRLITRHFKLNIEATTMRTMKKKIRLLSRATSRRRTVEDITTVVVIITNTARHRPTLKRHLLTRLILHNSNSLNR
jgi:hypothetical protein